jgi:hypothetical protein
MPLPKSDRKYVAKQFEEFFGNIIKEKISKIRIYGSKFTKTLQ